MRFQVLELLQFNGRTKIWFRQGSEYIGVFIVADLSHTDSRIEISIIPRVMCYNRNIRKHGQATSDLISQRSLGHMTCSAVQFVRFCQAPNFGKVRKRKLYRRTS